LMTCQVLKRDGLPALAYDAYLPQAGAPCVLFLSGYRSDMTGAKATYLAADARARQYNFIRFDYSGTGGSAGRFEDFGIGDWLCDARDILMSVVPQGSRVIVVGSSMGGWLALSLALAQPERVAAVIGIAAAPDFTQQMWADLTTAQRDEVMQRGFITLMGDAGRDPYYISRRMVEQGDSLALLDQSHALDVPVHLFYGQCDSVVPWQTGAKIAAVFPDTSVTIDLIPDGDHSLSRPEDMTRVTDLIDRYLG
jgi:pimeloyl-ACP methyl ester carboxylesterase